MKKGRVSVITTCYNYAHFLPFSIESALGQTHRDMEVVVVNDGSPDNTDEVIKAYLSDPRVVYVKQENTGQAVATNNGILASSGEFVAFLDADDIWHPTKVVKQLELFSASDVGVVYCRVELMDKDGAPVVREDNNKLLQPRSGRILEHLILDNFVPFSGSIARRVCFDKAGMLDSSLKMSTDWDLWLRMAVFYKFDYVDEILLRYRLGHPGQMTSNKEVHTRDAARVMDRFIESNRSLLPEGLVNRVYAYTYCNRGYRSRATNPKTSLRWYFKALKSKWTYGPAYLGLLKLAIVSARSLFTGAGKGA